MLNNYNDIGILFVCTFYYSVLTKLVHWWGVHEFSKSDYVIGTSNAGAYEKGNWINSIYYKKNSSNLQIQKSYVICSEPWKSSLQGFWSKLNRVKVQ